jgi:sugar (pentulose or hexulose) kinase
VTPARAVLAIDAGSSRLRVSVVDLEEGVVLGTASRPAPARDGELDVEELWGDLVELVRGVQRGGATVGAIAVAAQLALVLVDADGRSVRPALLWADQRAVDEANEIGARLGDDGVAAVGRRITAELPAAKLLWLARHEAEAMGRASRALSLKDALVLRLTGAAVTDQTHASYSGLFDVGARAWHGPALAAARIAPALLPPVAASQARAGQVPSALAALLDVPPRTPVAVGGPDGTLGAVGAGAVRPGVTVDVAGTTDVLLHTLERPLRDPSSTIVVNAHAAPGTWSAGGPTGLTGGAVEWTARLLGASSAAEACELHGPELDRMAPGAEGVLFLTAMGGSRFPTWRAADAGVVSGLRPEHGPAHVLRAAQEGAALAVDAGIDALRRAGADVREVVVVGGAAARAATLQLRADVWGLPVVALANREATTVGAAMLAGVTCGAFDDLGAAARAMVHPGERHLPRPDVARAFDAVRARWRALTERQLGPA